MKNPEAQKRRLENLKKRKKGDPALPGAGRPTLANGGFSKARAVDMALDFPTPQKLRAAILKKTGVDAITYEQAVIATLVANAARGSARHTEILFKLRGDFARVEAEVKRAIERDDGEDEGGSTLLIQVVRKTEIDARREKTVEAIPESGGDAVTG